jgi:lycopene cyclase domain-containing protein
MRANAVIAVTLLLIGLHWWLSPSLVPGLNFKPEGQVQLLPWLETRFHYLLLHIFTVVPVFSLSFDRRVHYYTRWKRLMPAILIPAAVFIAWDVAFTYWGVWGFNEAYFTGLTLFHLPVEEWLFFVTIPFACVFIYECLNYYVPADPLRRMEPWLTPALVLFFLLLALFQWERIYTATTSLFAAGLLLYYHLQGRAAWRSRFYMAFLVSLLPFLLINGALTGAYTEAPVVVYHPEAFMGIRITTIPVEDSLYGFALLFWVVALYETRFRQKDAR